MRDAVENTATLSAFFGDSLMLQRLLLTFICVSALMLTPAFTKDMAQQVVLWPDTGTPVLRFTFSKFKETGSIRNQHVYVTDTTAENISTKLISNGSFSLYLFDRSKVRIGEGWITVNNVGPGQTIKFETTIEASGTPFSVSVIASSQIPKSISMTINSVPQGAQLKVDGTDVGITPKLVQVGAGKHTLEFAKEGFNTGRFPLEIGANDVSGGSVSYELGAAAYDTIELRDGSVLSGDLISISGMDVAIRIGGSIQHVDRNKIKRVMLTERDAPTEPQLPPAQANP